ncbi:hypothetical protein J6590_036128 [Homalodisca vitripennis]|nr:hypothetical protein J6590_036128 [Homalodisca vitripennis]
MAASVYLLRDVSNSDALESPHAIPPSCRNSGRRYSLLVQRRWCDTVMGDTTYNSIVYKENTDVHKWNIASGSWSRNSESEKVATAQLSLGTALAPAMHIVELHTDS